MHENYQDRAKRDERYRELVKIHGKDNVTRSSISNQELHPEYVKDWDGPLERGFGNRQYRTFFKKIYSVAVR